MVQGVESFIPVDRIFFRQNKILNRIKFSRFFPRHAFSSHRRPTSLLRLNFKVPAALLCHEQQRSGRIIETTLNRNFFCSIIYAMFAKIFRSAKRYLQENCNRRL